MSPTRLGWSPVVILLVGLGFACAQEPASRDTSLDGAPAAWVGALDRTHLHLDDVLARGDYAAARQEIERALARPVPTGVRSEHARVAEQDLLYRLASLELSQGAPAAARDASMRGLARGRRVDLFTANLLFTAGRAAEGLGEDKRAAGLYHEALQINEVLLARALGQEGDAP